MIDNDGPQDTRGKGAPSGGTLIFLSILFLPAVIVGWAFYQLFRRGRQRLSVVASAVFVFWLILLGVWSVTGGISGIQEIIANLGEISSNWTKAIAPVLIVNFALGGLLGIFFVAWDARQMRVNPYRVQISGNWMYRFKYNRTPLQLLRRKKRIEKLKTGEFADPERAPLGLDEENDDAVVYRYGTEAVKQTLISGAAGSGKALHKDTKIPTPSGMKTVDQIVPGDTLFEENGKHTTVIGKYQPMTSDHYLLKFSDGTEIKACGDHLWEVEVLNKIQLRGARLNRIITDDQRTLLGAALKSIRESDLISISQLKEKFGIIDSLPLRTILKTIPSFPTSLYSVSDLKSVISKLNRGEVFRNKTTVLEFLDSVNKEFIDREELVSYVSRPALSNLQRTVQKTVTKEKFYNSYLTIKRILEDDSMRISRDEILSVKPKAAIEVVSTRDMLDFKTESGKSRYSIPLSGRVEYDEKELPVPAYVMGAWLGDGSSYGGDIGNADSEVRDECIKAGSVLLSEKTLDKEGRQRLYTWRFVGLFGELRKMGLLRNTKTDVYQKDIPEPYLYGSVQQRIDLIRGLIDTDGACSVDGSVDFGLTEKQVVEKARMVVSSLGWKATAIHHKENYARLDDGSRVKGKDSWSFSFYPDIQLFSIPRKADRLAKRLEGDLAQQIRHTRRYIVSVEKIEDNPEDYFCFEVDSPSHLFLCTESFIPTHNTITLLSLINNDIQRGAPVIVIDFKRSPELASKIASWTKEAGGNFYHFVNGSPKSYDVKNSPGQAYYDPLRNGSATAKADMVLGMREYDTASAVYKAAMQQLLQVLFAMLKYADRSKAPSIRWNDGGIYQVASAVTGSNLTELASACEGTPIQAEAEAIDIQSKGKTQIRHAMEELQGQIRTIVASEYGRWLKQSDDAANIDLFEMTKGSGNVILFSLNSDAEPDFARYIGAMILSDLTGVSAKRRNQKLTNQVMVYVDEFQAVPPTSVTSLLEKSRESRVAMTLAQQSFEQIIASSERNGEAYLLSILDTCSNFIVHNGATEDSAERLSKILGKKWVTSYRQSNQNQSSFLSTNWSNKRNATIQTSEEERWVFEPRQFMSLSSPDKNNGFKSTAVIINKTSSDPFFKDRTGGATARTVWMIPNKKVIQEYYEPSFDGEDDDGYKAPAVPVAIVPEVASNTFDDRSHEQPEEYDYFAAKALLQRSSSNDKEYESDDFTDSYDDEEDEEDEDGNFGYEVIGDENEDVDRELREASQLSSLPVLDFSESPKTVDKAEPIKKQAPVNSARSVRESSSFSSRFDSNFKPETLDRGRAVSNTQKERRVESKLPKVEKIEEDFDPDSISLPDIQF
jgi:hypothetical protein